MVEIATELQAEVECLPVGAKLASEHELMRRFDVSRSTVRRALEQLEARFLVRRVHGAGTFVHRRVDYLISSRLAPSLHATIEQAGASARTFLIAQRTECPPADVADRLGVDGDTECTKLVRVGYIDDQPATCVEEWLPPGTVDHIDVSLRAIESLAEVLRGSGHDPVRAWSRASTEIPRPAVAERLQLRTPVSTWQLETLTRDGAAGAPLLFSRSWMRQDRIRVVIEFDASAG